MKRLRLIQSGAKLQNHSVREVTLNMVIIMKTCQNLLRKVQKDKRKEEKMELFRLKILINSIQSVKHNNLINKMGEVQFIRQLQCDKVYLTTQRKNIVRITNLKHNQKFLNKDLN